MKVTYWPVPQWSRVPAAVTESASLGLKSAAVVAEMKPVSSLPAILTLESCKKKEAFVFFF